MFGSGRPVTLTSHSSAPLLPNGAKASSMDSPHCALDEITQPAEALTASQEPENLPLPVWQRVLRFCLHNWEKAIILAVLLALIILVSVKGVTVFKDIIHWFEKQNNWMGWTCFTLLYCLNIAILLPGILWILAAGFVFGFWKGLLAVWLGGGVGQSLAFLLARYLVGDWVSTLVRGKSKKWDVARPSSNPAYIDKAMELEGWKLLLLVRLSPLVPYNLLNLAMAATKIHFWAFAFVSFFGIIPECALFCYTGSLAENIGAIVSGEAKPHGVVTYVMAGVTVLLLLATTTWATVLIRQALKRADAHLREDPEAGGGGADAGNGLQHAPRTGEPEACRGDTAARLRSAPAALHPADPGKALSPFAAGSGTRCGRSSCSGSPRMGPMGDRPERARSAGARVGAWLGGLRHQRDAERHGSVASSLTGEPAPGAGLGARLSAWRYLRDPERQGSIASSGELPAVEPHRFWFGGAGHAHDTASDGVPLLNRAVNAQRIESTAYRR